jgi:hypothetical protein
MTVDKPAIEIKYDYVNNCFEPHSEGHFAWTPTELCTDETKNPAHPELRVHKRVAKLERIEVTFHNVGTNAPDMELGVNPGVDPNPFEGEPSRVIVRMGCPALHLMKQNPIPVGKQEIGFSLVPDGCGSLLHHTTIHVEC